MTCFVTRSPLFDGGVAAAARAVSSAVSSAVSYFWSSLLSSAWSPVRCWRRVGALVWCAQMALWCVAAACGLAGEAREASERGAVLTLPIGSVMSGVVLASGGFLAQRAPDAGLVFEGRDVPVVVSVSLRVPAHDAAAGVARSAVADLGLLCIAAGEAMGGAVVLRLRRLAIASPQVWQGLSADCDGIVVEDRAVGRRDERSAPSSAWASWSQQLWMGTPLVPPLLMSNTYAVFRDEAVWMSWNTAQDVAARRMAETDMMRVERLIGAFPAGFRVRVVLLSTVRWHVSP